jgi:hypothetical protein
LQLKGSILISRKHTIAGTSSLGKLKLLALRKAGVIKDLEQKRQAEFSQGGFD